MDVNLNHGRWRHKFRTGDWFSLWIDEKSICQALYDQLEIVSSIYDLFLYIMSATVSVLQDENW